MRYDTNLSAEKIKIGTNGEDAIFYVGRAVSDDKLINGTPVIEVAGKSTLLVMLLKFNPYVEIDETLIPDA